jgi:hypothetical protein
MPQKLTKQSKKLKLPNPPKKPLKPPKALKQPREQTNRLNKLSKLMYGGNSESKPEDVSNFLFLDSRVSTQPNTDPTFIESGIIHLCDSVAINALRASVTSFFNAFGSSGFDSTLYDLARNNCLKRIVNVLNIKDKQIKEEGRDIDLKVCNIRFEMLSLDPSLITINAYGTLLSKSNDQPKQESEQQPEPEKEPEQQSEQHQEDQEQHQ